MSTKYAKLAGVGATGVAALLTYHMYLPKYSTLDSSNGHYTPLKLISSSAVSKTTRRLLISTKHVRIAQNDLTKTQTFHYYIREPNGQSYRAFTPLPLKKHADFFELIVKSYPAPNGDVSRYVNSLESGDHVLVHGPHFTFDIDGFVARLNANGDGVTKLGLVAGGTGIAPIYQLVDKLKDVDNVHMDVIYCAASSEELLLKDEFDKIASVSGGKVKVHYFVDKGMNNDGALKIGRVTMEDIKRILPETFTTAVLPQIFVCGPPGMTRALCGASFGSWERKLILGGLLKQAGYHDGSVFVF